MILLLKLFHGASLTIDPLNSVWQLEDELDVFKYRVLSQAMLDIEDTPEDGSASKVLSPPQVREHGWMFG